MVENLFLSEENNFEGNIDGISVPRLVTDKISLFDKHETSITFNPKINLTITAINKILTARYFSMNN